MAEELIIWQISHQCFSQFDLLPIHEEINSFNYIWVFLKKQI